MNDFMKFNRAIMKLKTTDGYQYGGVTEVNEETFNSIEWVIGVDEKGECIFQKENPHPEITWTKVKEEMDKL
jgi:hypothetical protein